MLEAKWEREAFRDILRKSIIEVTFTKADGNERIMYATLMVPSDAKVTKDDVKVKKLKTINPEVMAVWDVNAKAWRSFRFDSITNWQEV